MALVLVPAGEPAWRWLLEGQRNHGLVSLDLATLILVIKELSTLVIVIMELSTLVLVIMELIILVLVIMGLVILALVSVKCLLGTSDKSTKILRTAKQFTPITFEIDS